MRLVLSQKKLISKSPTLLGLRLHSRLNQKQEYIRYQGPMMDPFLLVWHCKHFSRKFMKNVYAKKCQIMSTVIYSLRMLPIINFFHALNFNLFSCTVGQCIYTGGFVPSLFVILPHFVIPAALCKRSCRTLQSMPQFVTHSVTLSNPKPIAFCNLTL